MLRVLSDMYFRLFLKILYLKTKERATGKAVGNVKKITKRKNEIKRKCNGKIYDKMHKIKKI